MVPPLKAHMTSVLAVRRIVESNRWKVEGDRFPLSIFHFPLFSLFLQIIVGPRRFWRVAAIHRFARVAGHRILFQLLTEGFELLTDPFPDTIFNLSFHHRPPSTM